MTHTFSNMPLIGAASARRKPGTGFSDAPTGAWDDRGTGTGAKNTASAVFFALSYHPAHAQSPCIRAYGSSVVFSAVFHNEGEHGLQLIHIPDGETFYIPLTEEYRVGCVYSVRIDPFDAGEWLYRYRSGGRWVLDRHARGIRMTAVKPGTRVLSSESLSTGVSESFPEPLFESASAEESGPVAACVCAPVSGKPVLAEGPVRPLPPADWNSQLIYGIHIRGLTAAKPAGFPGRGTFDGVTAMIPYLQSLGVTAVELMPVYQPLPERRGRRTFRTMQEALGAWPVGPQGDPLRDMKDRPNYWGYGRGLYYAIRPEYGTPDMFARMVRALHGAGIRVLMQICFENGMQPGRQIDLLRFYVECYGIDGFRLLGDLRAVEAIASAPELAGTALLYHDFPYAQLRGILEAEKDFHCEELDSLSDLRPMPSLETLEAGPEQYRDPAAPVSAEGFEGFLRLMDAEPGERPRTADGKVPVPASRSLPATQRTAVRFPGLISCGGDFQTLLRRFVKSDDYVMKDFLKFFLSSPADHPELRTVTCCDGFTLADLVSYNERHNEDNGEFGLDGTADNYSWNCGEEGETKDPGILALRRRQTRNFLTLLFLAQGTPMLRQGDERCNSQQGNNNPYCQDNQVSWIDWTPAADRDRLTAFTSRLAAFRREHPVFRGQSPFHYMDTLGIGHPDVSLHGDEAWKPDLGPFSHSIGIAYCEAYADSAPSRRSGRNGKQAPLSFLYLGINMYWKELSLALPKLPPHYIWKVCLDTASEEGFLRSPAVPRDQHYVRMPARSIRLLRSVPDIDAIAREMREERLRARPSSRAVRRAGRKKMHRDPSALCRRLLGRSPAALRRMGRYR